MSEKRNGNENLTCSFCVKNQKEVGKLTVGPMASICGKCIGLCIEIINKWVDETN